MSDIAIQKSSDATAVCLACGLHHAEDAPCPVGLRNHAPATSAILPNGTIVGGRFEIEMVTHRSGMSTIYRAVDRTGQPGTVAVKQLSVSGLSADELKEARSWLAREAGLLSSLKSPHLPELYAAFSEGDNHFVVMPYLVGKTIQERVESGGPLPEPVVRRWVRTLTEVLAYLHSQDPPIIHRDLKPSNILVLPDNRLILLDLGVARPASRGIPGTAIGTPGYAPPEQYQGLADERSDLYALGATMHYMLTGYDGDQAAPFRHSPVRSLRPDISPAVDTLVTALLELAPANRPASAGIVGSRLDMVPVLAVREVYARSLRRYLSVGAALTTPAAGLSFLSIVTTIAVPGALLTIPPLIALIVLWGRSLSHLSGPTSFYDATQGQAEAGAATYDADALRRAHLQAGDIGSDVTIPGSDAAVALAQRRAHLALKIPLSLGLLLWIVAPLALGWTVAVLWLLCLIPLLAGWRAAVRRSQRQQRVIEEAGALLHQRDRALPP